MITVTELVYLVNGMLKCEHIQWRTTLTSDYFKRLSLYIHKHLISVTQLCFYKYDGKYYRDKLPQQQYR